MTCTKEACSKKVLARGLCGTHYAYQRKRGLPPIVRKPIEQRFWERVITGDGCWLWIGSRGSNNYGNFYIGGGRWIKAHRLAYFWVRGAPTRAGLVPDHLCRNPQCVNPWHIEWVSSRENALRGYGPTAVNATKIACHRGHAFTPENTYMGPAGNRACRKCHIIHNREYRRRAARSLGTLRGPKGEPERTEIEVREG